MGLLAIAQFRTILSCQQVFLKDPSLPPKASTQICLPPHSLWSGSKVESQRYIVMHCKGAGCSGTMQALGSLRCRKLTVVVVVVAAAVAAAVVVVVVCIGNLQVSN